MVVTLEGVLLEFLILDKVLADGSLLAELLALNTGSQHELLKALPEILLAESTLLVEAVLEHAGEIGLKNGCEVEIIDARNVAVLLDILLGGRVEMVEPGGLEAGIGISGNVAALLGRPEFSPGSVDLGGKGLLCVDAGMHFEGNALLWIASQ